jgi:hypothetical protein
MNRRWILGAVVLLVLAGGIAAAAIWGPDGRWDDRHDGVEVVRVVDEDGNATTTDGDTIVIARERGFFPFGLFLFPLGFLFVILLVKLVFWGSRGGGGPWRGEPSPQWLEEWHRRQHADSQTPPGAASGQ